MNKKIIGIILISALCGVANANPIESNNISMYGLDSLFLKNNKEIDNLYKTNKTSQQNNEENKLLKERQEIVQRIAEKNELNNEIEGDYQSSKLLWASGGITKEEFKQRMEEVSLMKEELLALEDIENQPLKTLSNIQSYKQRIDEKEVNLQKQKDSFGLKSEDYQSNLNDIRIMNKTYKYSLNNYIYNLE